MTIPVNSYGIPLECEACHADLRDRSRPGDFSLAILHIDAMRDCLTAYVCPHCRHVTPRSIGEICAIQELPPGTPE